MLQPREVVISGINLHNLLNIWQSTMVNCSLSGPILLKDYQSGTRVRAGLAAVVQSSSS